MRPSILLLFLVVITVTAAARADDPSSGDTALAEALFRDARTLMDKKKYDEACPKLEESYRLVPKLGTLLNLATCHEDQGRTGTAWGEYTKAVSLAKQVGELERVDYAREKLEKLEKKLSKLIIEVPEPVAGIEVVIDDKAIGKAAWKTPIPLDPGSHAVEARAPGHATWSKSVDVPPGPSTITETVPGLKVIDEGEVAKPTGGDGGAGRNEAQWVAGWVVGAIGLVSVGIGAGFGGLTFAKQGESEDHCEETLCDQDGVDLRDEARTTAMVSNVTIGVGAAALVTGIVLLATAGSDGAPEAAAHIVPVEGGLGVGVAW